MINEERIRDKLYEEFIKPTNQDKNFIGIEIEIPIINLDKKAVDFDVVHTSSLRGSWPSACVLRPLLWWCSCASTCSNKTLKFKLTSI